MYYRRRVYDRRRVAIIAAVAATGVLLTEAPLTDQVVPPYQAVPRGFFNSPLVRACDIDPKSGQGICELGVETIFEIDSRTGRLAYVDGVPAVMTVDPNTGRITSVGVSPPPVTGAPTIVDGPAGPAGDW